MPSPKHIDLRKETHPYRFSGCRRTIAALAVSCLLAAGSATARDTRTVYDTSGKPMFELTFFDQGERYDEYEDNDFPGYSPWQLDSNQKQAIIQAVGLWADVLGPGSSNSAPLPVEVGTYFFKNADAASQSNNSDDRIVNTGIQDGILHDITPDFPGKIHIGPLELGIPDHLSPIPDTAKN